jgi:hypothetical protein
MADWLAGTWKLVAWRRITGDGAISYPLGADARGQLIYTPDGTMAVQITGANRPLLATGDPLGGGAQVRADAYSTYLAYFGTYEVQGESIIHRIEGSLFPDWSSQEQARQLTRERGELILRTPPMQIGNGTTVVNELAWAREDH